MKSTDLIRKPLIQPVPVVAEPVVETIVDQDYPVADFAALFETAMAEDAEGLNIGDPVIITGKVQFNGKTGDIVDFGKDKRFVIVNLYNYGKHSFHSSDVSYNDYAGGDDEEARMYDAGEFRDSDLDEGSMSTATKHQTGPKFTGYWKGKDSRTPGKHMVGASESKKMSTQQKFEKHLAKHGYDVAEKSKYWAQKIKDIDAQIAAWDAEMKKRKQGS